MKLAGALIRSAKAFITFASTHPYLEPIQPAMCKMCCKRARMCVCACQEFAPKRNPAKKRRKASKSKHSGKASFNGKMDSDLRS
jgi:hypothetical protein